ncbi:MAG: hypothetical protein WBA93_11795, partial [Microcoleaceae cyanobacterium]
RSNRIINTKNIIPKISNKMKKINQIKLVILARGIISLIVTSQPNLTEENYSKALAQTASSTPKILSRKSQIK